MSKWLPAPLQNFVEQIRDRVMPVARKCSPWTRDGESAEINPEAPMPGILTRVRGPAIRVVDIGAAIVVSAEMPGLDRDDFHVEIDGTRLILRGEKRQVRQSRGDNAYYHETVYGSFYRTVSLPCRVEADKVRAKYRNGVLEVRLPKVTGRAIGDRLVPVH